jgi:hypothetical protein
MASALIPEARGEVQRKAAIVVKVWLVSMLVYIEVASAVKKWVRGVSKVSSSSFFFNSKGLFK